MLTWLILTGGKCVKKKRSGGVHPFKSRLNLAPPFFYFHLHFQFCTLPHFNIWRYYYLCTTHYIPRCYFLVFCSVDWKEFISFKFLFPIAPPVSILISCWNPRDPRLFQGGLPVENCSYNRRPLKLSDGWYLNEYTILLDFHGLLYTLQYRIIFCTTGVYRLEHNEYKPYVNCIGASDQQHYIKHIKIGSRSINLDLRCSLVWCSCLPVWY